MLRQLVWLGSSRKELKSLPSEVQDEIGYALYQAQLDHLPKGAKTLKGLRGVIEILSDFDGDTYRAAYTAKIVGCIGVLHVFKKKSKMGIKTPRENIELIKDRLKIARAIERGGW